MEHDLQALLELAEQHDLQALLELAEQHDAAGDYYEATHWFKQAAQAGDASAQYALYVHYQCGLGVNPDETKANHYLAKAVEQGYAPARFFAGVALLNNPATHDHGVAMMEQAAKDDCLVGQQSLALYYREGVVLPQDAQRAQYWADLVAQNQS